MSEVVLDASALVKLLVEESGSERVEGLVASGQPMLAPDHVLIETANALWKKARRQGLPAQDALEALEEALRYDIELVPTSELLGEALAVSCQLPHPLYDTLYLLLALRGGRMLATADARMRDAAEALGVRVAWVGASAG